MATHGHASTSTRPSHNGLKGRQLAADDPAGRPTFPRGATTVDDTTTIDITSAAFAARLANLLRQRRRELGTSIRRLARLSGGAFTPAQLKELEAGEGSMEGLDLLALASLYHVDLSVILPRRLPLIVDETVGRIATAGISSSFVAGDEDSLLTAYLRLVRELRSLERAPEITLRRGDVEALAAHLRKDGALVLDRLGQLMGASVTQRRSMVATFAAGAALIVLAGGAIALEPGSHDPADLDGARQDLPVATARADHPTEELGVAPSSTQHAGDDGADSVIALPGPPEVDASDRASSGPVAAASRGADTGRTTDAGRATDASRSATPGAPDVPSAGTPVDAGEPAPADRSSGPVDVAPAPEEALSAPSLPISLGPLPPVTDLLEPGVPPIPEPGVPPIPEPVVPTIPAPSGDDGPSDDAGVRAPNEPGGETTGEAELPDGSDLPGPIAETGGGSGAGEDEAGTNDDETQGRGWGVGQVPPGASDGQGRGHRGGEQTGDTTSDEPGTSGDGTGSDDGDTGSDDGDTDAGSGHDDTDAESGDLRPGGSHPGQGWGVGGTPPGGANGRAGG
jgi:transcriptional regulator with XRE-family HTH domain